MSGYTTHKKDKHGRYPWEYNWTGTVAATKFSREQLKRMRSSAPSPALLASMGKDAASEPGSAPRARARSRVRVPLAPLDAKLRDQIAKAFKKEKDKGTCAAIRALANSFALDDLLRALPDLNASTVRIQYRKGRK